MVGKKNTGRNQHSVGEIGERCSSQDSLNFTSLDEAKLHVKGENVCTAGRIEGCMQEGKLQWITCSVSDVKMKEHLTLVTWFLHTHAAKDP